MSGDRPSVIQPLVLWAQRDDCLYITISLGDIKKKDLKVEENTLTFRASAGRDKVEDYEVKLEFFKPVSTEEPKVTTTDREYVINIKKKENGTWPRLLQSAARCPWLKTDFNRWKDEDSEPEMYDDFSKMLSQMPKYDNNVEGDLDSDDEDLPDLAPYDGSSANAEVKNEDELEED